MASTKIEAIRLATQSAVPMYSIGVQGELLAASCPGGTSECLGGGLATADVTNLHDERLVEATKSINLIIQNVARCRTDRKPELINVGGEVLLCWTTDSLPQGFKPVTDIMEIRRLLRLRESSRDKSGSGSSNSNDGRNC